MVETIQPNAPGRIVSRDESVSVLFPTLSRPHTFQAGISANPKHCLSESELPGTILACVRVDTFDELGRAEADAILMLPARLTIILRQGEDGTAGDVSALMRARDMGGVRFMFREYLSEEWAEIPFSLSFVSNGGVTASAARRQFGIFALALDMETLRQARVQDNDTPADPTVTPSPASEEESASLQMAGYGAVFGLLMAILVPYLVMLQYMKMLGVL